MKYVWEGRFKEEASEELIDFTSSVDIDKELALYDIKGSIAPVSYTHLTLPTICSV